MEIRKTLKDTEGYERECIFFTVRFNNFRDVSASSAHEVLDCEQIEECECVICLPKSYSEEGEPTPLIMSFHGAGSRVSCEDGKVGGVRYLTNCIDKGYAVMDVCGSAPHGLTMGCPEHIFAAYKAYRYATSHYNLSKQVLVAGASMGGHTGMNFVNTFPSIVLAAGLFYPRLNMDGVNVGDHYSIGTWDKVNVIRNGKNSQERICELYRFPSGEWCEQNTLGFNPHKTRSFINSDGERVIMPPCPIKIWQGTADTTVDPVFVEEYVRAVRRSGSYIELHLLDGVGHHLTPVMREEIGMWFDRFI